MTLYRASADPYSWNAWRALQAGQPVVDLVDQAYLFTSLDEKFVEGWNKHELRGKGVILEIQAQPGVPVGYIDRGETSRDYAEVILARGQKLIPTLAYTDANGVPRLRVMASPAAR